MRAPQRYAEVELSGVVGQASFSALLVTFIWHDPWGAVQTYVLWPVVGAVVGFIACTVFRASKKTVDFGGANHRSGSRTQPRAAFTAHGLHDRARPTRVSCVFKLPCWKPPRRGLGRQRASTTRFHRAPGMTWCKSSPTVWRSGNACDAFCKAVERCGETLAQLLSSIPGRSRRDCPTSS